MLPDNVSPAELFISSLVALALPTILLLALRVLFAWRYRNTVVRYMNQTGVGPFDTAAGSVMQEESSPIRQRLSLCQVEGRASMTSLAYNKLCEARRASMRVRWIFAIAGSIQMMSTAGAVYWILCCYVPKLSMIYPPLLTAYFTMIPGLAILVAFVVRGTRSRMALLAVYLSAAFIIIVLGPDNILIDDPLIVPLHLQAALNNSTVPLLGIGLLLMPWLRPFLLAGAAIGTYLFIGTLLYGVIFWNKIANMNPLDISPLSVWLSIANTCLGAILLYWLLRMRRRETLIADLLLVTIVFIAWAVERWLFLNLPVGTFAIGMAINVLQFCILWLVFKGFVRLQVQTVIPSEILHLDLCWLFLALINSQSISGYVGFATKSQDLPDAIGLGFFLGLTSYAGYAIFLHLALRRNWIAHRDRLGRKLLLLRVFGNAVKRVRLMDMLGETWRRAGRIDFIGGTDLAQRHVAAHALEAFLLGRLNSIFLKSRAEVDQRVQGLRYRLEGDLRYPLNDLYCYADAWQYAVRQIARESDVVIMDLRDFTSRNQGCAFELGVLVQIVPLERIILLTDRTTDESALAKTIQDAWQAVPADSPNLYLANPKVLLIRFTGKSEMDRDFLESWLFTIAFGATSYSYQT